MILGFIPSLNDSFFNMNFWSTINLSCAFLSFQLLSARDMAQRKVITPEEIVYTTQKDLLEQDYEVKEWERRFKELESEWWARWIYLTHIVALHDLLSWLDDKFLIWHPSEWKIWLNHSTKLNLMVLDPTDRHTAYHQSTTLPCQFFWKLCWFNWKTMICKLMYIPVSLTCTFV